MSETTQFNYHKKELPGGIYKVGIILLLAGLILAVVAYFVDGYRTAYNSQILFTFLTSIGVGSLFLICIEYIAGAVWSVPFRRVAEILAGLIIIAPIFALPSIFNFHHVFHWADPELVSKDNILKAKAPYLNETFFFIRNAIIFLLWGLFYFLITKNSRKQDESYDQQLTKKNIKLSAIFIPIFAISLTIISIDWLMSLEPHWFSTIFGVYYFAGSILAALATFTFISVSLTEKGFLLEGLKRDHYYSMGALMFAFINFWAYIAFSQFMLIWYANLPEETFWFITRWQGSWSYVSYGIIFIHFLVPYILLLPQPAKMDPKRLKLVSIWILFAHYYDLYWLAMPNFDKTGIVFSWFEIVFPILGVGLIIVIFYYLARKINLVPIGDPKLKRGMDFRL